MSSYKRRRVTRTVDCPVRRQAFLVLERLPHALEMTSVEHTRMLALKDSMQGARPTAENGAGTSLESDDGGKAL
jgi:hypothetical protein